MLKSLWPCDHVTSRGKSPSQADCDYFRPFFMPIEFYGAHIQPLSGYVWIHGCVGSKFKKNLTFTTLTTRMCQMCKRTLWHIPYVLQIIRITRFNRRSIEYNTNESSLFWLSILTSLDQLYSFILCVCALPIALAMILSFGLCQKMGPIENANGIYRESPSDRGPANLAFFSFLLFSVHVWINKQ